MDFTVRMADVGDAELIATQRCEMFKDMGRLTEEAYRILHEATIRYLQIAIPSGEYAGFFVQHDGQVVSGGGIHMRRVMPRPNRQGLIIEEAPQALVVNIYTHPDYRRKGLATRVMQAIEVWVQEQEIPWVVLHASDMGRPLYDGMGYLPTNELTKYFDVAKYRLG